MGIRKAKECGKWIGPAPIGYTNYTYPDGTKTIIQKEPEASIIRQAFMKLINGTPTILAIYHHALQQGLKCSRSNFWNLIKNPVYAGKMKWVGEDRKIMVTYGRHIGIVSEQVFNKVQELFKRQIGPYCIGYSTDLPFRGFMLCPRCGKTLTGSASSGRTKKYFYYHCRQRCNYRLSTRLVFEWFLERLTKLQWTDVCFKNYQDILGDLISERHKNISSQKSKALKSIDQFFERMTKAKELMLNKDVTFEAYCEIKNDCEIKIKALGEIVNSCVEAEYSLVEKHCKMAKRVLQLDEFFYNLDDKHRSNFLNCFLSRPANWEEKNHQSIFSLPVVMLFRNNANPIDNGDCRKVSAVNSLLRHLAQLQLSFEHKTGLV